MTYFSSHTSQTFPYVYDSQILMGSLNDWEPVIKKDASTYRFGFQGQENESFFTILFQN